MSQHPSDLNDDAIEFLTERHIATLTTVDERGRPHAVAVGFTWDPEAGLARIISQLPSKKVQRLLANPGSEVTVCQVGDNGRWMAMEGPASVSTDTDHIAEAVRRYALRYREPTPNPDRVAIEITVARVIGRW